jgi:DNA-binding NarL/FixJ family response regulator
MNETRKQIGIIVVDDHPIVAAGIRSVVEDCAALRVLGQASSGHEAIELCIAHHPDVLLLDLRLPDLPGAEVCRRVKTLCPNTRVLILTSYGDDANVMTAIASGADGYLLKHSAGPSITEALIQVARGGQVLDPAVTGAVMRQATGEEKEAPQKLALSELDLTILRLLSTGLRNKEIGAAVGLSEKTVRNHLSHIFATLGVQTRTEAAVLYGKMSSSKSDGSV